MTSDATSGKSDIERAGRESLIAARSAAFEWSVLYPNGVRVRCETEADARAVEDVSSGKAQWRTDWQDADVRQIGQFDA